MLYGVHSFILAPPPLRKLFPLLSSPFKKIKIGFPPLTDQKTEKFSSHMKHTHLGIYQIYYSEACLPADKMSEENGVSYTDIDQLIRKRQNVVEKSSSPPPPPPPVFKIVHFHVPPPFKFPPLIFRKFTPPPPNKIFGNLTPPPPPLQKGGSETMASH